MLFNSVSYQIKHQPVRNEPVSQTEAADKQTSSDRASTTGVALNLCKSIGDGHSRRRRRRRRRRLIQLSAEDNHPPPPSPTEGRPLAGCRRRPSVCSWAVFYDACIDRDSGPHGILDGSPLRQALHVAAANAKAFDTNEAGRSVRRSR